MCRMQNALFGEGKYWGRGWEWLQGWRWGDSEWFRTLKLWIWWRNILSVHVVSNKHHQYSCLYPLIHPYIQHTSIQVYILYEIIMISNHAHPCILTPCIPKSFQRCNPVSLHPYISVSLFSYFPVPLYLCTPVSLYPCISVSPYPCISVSLYLCNMLDTLYRGQSITILRFDVRGCISGQHKINISCS